MLRLSIFWTTKVWLKLDAGIIPFLQSQAPTILEIWTIGMGELFTFLMLCGKLKMTFCYDTCCELCNLFMHVLHCLISYSRKAKHFPFNCVPHTYYWQQPKSEFAKMWGMDIGSWCRLQWQHMDIWFQVTKHDNMTELCCI